MDEREKVSRHTSDKVTLAHVKAVLDAGQILASVLTPEEWQNLSESSDRYPFQPLTLAEGDRNIGGIVKPSEEAI